MLGFPMVSRAIPVSAALLDSVAVRFGKAASNMDPPAGSRCKLDLELVTGLPITSNFGNDELLLSM